MDIETIKDKFEAEFQGIRDKFEDPLELDVQGARNSNINKPGVYVIWNGTDSVIKVGRRLTNSRACALQHLAMPTRYKGDNAKTINSLDLNKVKIILFNVKNRDDKHWVAALEIFFELKLNPKIKAKRL